MTKPWVILVGGISGLFVVGLAVKHFSGSGDSELRVASLKRSESANRLESAASAPAGPNGERSGWSVRADPDAPQKAGGAGAQNAATGKSGTEGVNGERSERGGRGTASVITGGQRRPSNLGSNPLSPGRYADADSIHVDAVLPNAVPFEGSKPLGSGPMGGSHQGAEVRQVQEQRPPTEPNTASAEPNAISDEPVLSLSFDKTTVPEKGDTAPVVEQGITFDSGEGAVFDTNSQFAVPDGGNIKGDAGSISFRIQPKWDGSDSTDASLVQLSTPNIWENRIEIVKNGQWLRFMFFDNTGIESGTGARIDNWQSGDSHDITTTWGKTDTGANELSLFVDGHLAGKQTYDGQLEVPPGRPLFIGSNYSGEKGAGAAISNFQVYDHSLPPDRVSTLASAHR